jgi:hypothetical protein
MDVVTITRHPFGVNQGEVISPGPHSLRLHATITDDGVIVALAFRPGVGGHLGGADGIRSRASRGG